MPVRSQVARTKTISTTKTTILTEAVVNKNTTPYYQCGIRLKCNIANGNPQITIVSDIPGTLVARINLIKNLYVGCPVTGTGIPASSYIISIDSASTFTINANCTATTNNLTTTFDIPSSTVANVMANAISINNRSASATANLALIGQLKAAASQSCASGQNKWYTTNNVNLFTVGDVVVIDPNGANPEIHTIASVVYNAGAPTDVSTNYVTFGDNLTNTFTTSKYIHLVSQLFTVAPSTQVAITQVPSFNNLQLITGSGASHNMDFNIYKQIPDFTSSSLKRIYKSKWADNGNLANDIYPLIPQCVPNRISLVDDPITGSGKVIKFNFAKADDFTTVTNITGSTSPRCEVYMDYINHPELHMVENGEYLIKCKSLYKTAEFDIETYASNEMLISQIHQDLATGSPVTGIELDKDILQNRFYVNDSTNRYDVVKNVENFSIKQLLDKWTEWEMYIKASYTTNGKIIIFRNGTNVCDFVGKTMYKSNSSYLKAGMYKSLWKTSNSSCNSMIGYLKEIEMYSA